MDTDKLANDLKNNRLNLLEQARALQALEPRRRSKHGVTLGELARRIGRSQEWLRRRLVLLDLPDEVLQAAGDGRFTASNLESIADLPKHLRKSASLRLLREKSEGKVADTEDLHNRTTRQSAKRIKAQLQYLINNGIDGLPARLLAWCLGRVEDHQIRKEIKENFPIGEDDDDSEEDPRFSS
jgi:ParB-like chromosome segregation protein Spo0J